MTSSESLPVNHVTSVAGESSVVTSSRELMTSSAAMSTSSDAQQTPAAVARPARPAPHDDLDDDVMTSWSRDHDLVTSWSRDGEEEDNCEDEDSADETVGVVTSPSAADMKQQVDLGPEVSGCVFIARDIATDTGYIFLLHCLG